MKITSKGRYGLRAMVDLAVNSETEPVSIHSIGERQDISDGYLEQLIAKLKRAGLVESIRGSGRRLPPGTVGGGDLGGGYSASAGGQPDPDRVPGAGSRRVSAFKEPPV